MNKKAKILAVIGQFLKMCRVRISYSLISNTLLQGWVLINVTFCCIKCKKLIVFLAPRLIAIRLNELSR